MKLRNLIFALFLAIGAIGFTACTGDDGAPGAQGEKGEQGEKGDPGDPGTATGTYDFLKAWGSETGRVACDDPLLMESKPFPGGDDLELKPILDSTTEMPAPVSLEVSCNTNVFDEIAADSTAIMVQGLTNRAVGSLIFVKSGTAMQTDKADPKVVPSTEVSQAKTVVTEVNFSGGSFFAEMSNTGGNDEVDERRILYSACENGTAPSSLRGEWRALVKTEVTTPHDATTKLPVTASAMTTTTTKVCVRLDSVLGAVKCFIRVDGPAPATPAVGSDVVEQIAIYDGTQEEEEDMISTVVAGTAADPTASTDKVLPAGTSAATTANAVQEFVSASDIFATEASNVAKICHLFEGAAVSN